MKRHNIPIEKHYLPKGVNSGITYNKSYSEIEACVAAGLDYYLWRTNEYPDWLKAEVVTWHRLRGLVTAHQKSAEAKEIEKRSKKKTRK